ncbi:MAG: hypothetical protein LBS77_04510 [Desulfovibrio sp.]|nr:hypothetical protein [Desulfovibrio sp.]
MSYRFYRHPFDHAEVLKLIVVLLLGLRLGKGSAQDCPMLADGFFIYWRDAGGVCAHAPYERIVITNKMTRTAWAVFAEGVLFEPTKKPVMVKASAQKEEHERQ